MNDLGWRVRWTPAQITEACERYGAGETYLEIALGIGVSRGSVAGLLNRLRQFALSPEDSEIMCDLVAREIGFDRVADVFKTSVANIEFSFASVRRAMGKQAV